MHRYDNQTNSVSPDISEAIRFLSILGGDHSQFVFSTIEEPKTPTRAARTRSYMGTLTKNTEQLLQDNLSGMGIFFTVNATDGRGRKKENIVGVRAVFVDLDGSPLEPVLAAPLRPHIVVESSPGRYHAYWIIEQMPLDRFSDIQKNLAARFDGDPSVCDLPRLMRLPGFLHLKNEPFQSRVMDISSAPPYSAEAFELAFYQPHSQVDPKPRIQRGTLLQRLQEAKLVIRCEDEMEGRWLIRCPWADQHTSGGNDAHYFAKPSHMYPGEGFKCFHMHCAERTIRDVRLYFGLESQDIDPLPLFREVPEPADFPVDALGPILAPATTVIHQIVKAPVAVIAQSFLAAASLVTQPYANIILDGRQIALSLFMVTVAESGERKSAVDDIALAAILRYQQMLYRTYQDDFRRYEITHDSWKTAKKTGTPAEFEPIPPIKPLILIEEPTYEGLVKYLEEGQPSVGLFSDEGGRFLGGNAMNRDNLLKTLTGLSSLWDAKTSKPITRIRSGDKTLALYGRRVALHLMTQESVYSKLNEQQLCETQGFLPRCLITFPKSMAGQRPYSATDPSKSSEVIRFWDRCNELLDCKLPLASPPAPPNQLEPREIWLSAEARALWISYHDNIDKELGEQGLYRSIRRFGSKAPEHALRVAGVLALFENSDAIQIEATHVQRATEIIDYYFKERLRLESYCMIDPHLRTAQRVLDWAKAKGKQEILPRELYQYGPQEVRSKDKAMRTMATLESHGRAIQIPAAEVKLGAKGKAWRLVWIDEE